MIEINWNVFPWWRDHLNLAELLQHLIEIGHPIPGGVGGLDYWVVAYLRSPWQWTADWEEFCLAVEEAGVLEGASEDACAV